jgi:hypothetical protein
MSRLSTITIWLYLEEDGGYVFVISPQESLTRYSN